MFGWILLIVIAGLVFFGFLKLEHSKRTFKLLLMLAALILLIASVYYIASKNSIDMTSPKDIARGGYLYATWIGNVISNLWNVSDDVIKTLGNAIKGNTTA